MSHRAVRLMVAVSIATIGIGPVPVTAQSPSGLPDPSGSMERTPTTLPPDGGWQVELTTDELIAAGAPADGATAGVYTWTFDGGRARIEVRYAGGGSDTCDADIKPAGDAVLFTYDLAACGGEVDTIRWALDDDGLHLSLVATNAPFEQNRAYLEAKPWQPVDGGSIASAPPWQSRCESGCQGPVEPGIFTSVGFIPGLAMTFADDAWFNTADYLDEMEFDSASNALRLWQTPFASSATGDPLFDVPRTPAGFTHWFVGNNDMVVSDPETVTIGDGIEATTFTFRISDSNVNVDPGCPAGVRSCLNVLWIANRHVFAIGYGEAVRLYLFTVGTGSDAQTILISLDAPDEAQLAAMTTQVAPILESIRLPE